MPNNTRDPMTSAIVRLRSNGSVQGAGVLLAPDRVATCAHVVAPGLGVKPDSEQHPSGAVAVEFPLIPGAPTAAAEVVDWHPIRPDGRGDVAILRLRERAPEGALPAPARVSAGDWLNRFSVLGFPRGHDDGVWVTGELLGPQGTGWRQIRADPHQPAIQRGFSGAPVWDFADGCVAGIVVTAATDDDTTAYLLPTGELGESWRTGLVNPYRGLRSFGEQDARFFHGRDDEVRTVLRLLDEQRRVVLTGASGSGKSSLVCAGVVPELRNRGLPITTVRPVPGEDPSVVLRGVTDRDELLFLDQFEEYVSADPAQARELLNLLTELTSGRLRAILTLRPGSLEDLVTAGTSDWLNDATYLLGPMTTQQLRDAMTRPAETVGGLAFEAGLVDRILGDAPAESRALPLVSLVLDQLWQHRVGGFLTHEAYQRIGRVQGALSRTADAAYLDLPLRDRAPAQSLLKLLTRRDLKGFSRRALRWSEIPPELHPIARELAGRRLIVIEDGGGQRVELVHQALITHWERLQDWLRADAAFVSWQEELRHNVRQWRDSGADSGYLLRGEALTTAKEYARGRPAELTPEQREFIERSDRASRRRMRQWRTISALALTLALIASGLAFGMYRGNVSLSRRLHEQNAERLLESAERSSSSDAREALQLTLAAWHESPGSPLATGAVLEQRAMFENVRSVLPAPLGAKFDTSRLSGSVDGRTLLIGGYNGSAAVDLNRWFLVRFSGEPGHPVVTELPVPPSATAALSPDGTTIAVADERRAVTLWDARTVHPFAELPMPGPGMAPIAREDAHYVGFSGDGRYLSYRSTQQPATEERPRTVTWDAARRAPVAEQLIDLPAVSEFSPTRDPATVVAGVHDALGAGRLVSYTNGVPTELGRGKITAHGDQVVRYQPDGSAEVLDTLTRQPVRRLPGQDQDYPSPPADPMGRYFPDQRPWTGAPEELSGIVLDRSTDRYFQVGELPEAQGGGADVVTTLAQDERAATGVVLHPDGLYVVAMPRVRRPEPVIPVIRGHKVTIASNDSGEILALDPALTRTFGRTRDPAPGRDTETYVSRDESRLYGTKPDSVLVFRTSDLSPLPAIQLPPQAAAHRITELETGELVVLNRGRLLRFNPNTGAPTGPPVELGQAPPTPDSGDVVKRRAHPGEVLVRVGGSLRVLRLVPGSAEPRRIAEFPLPPKISGLRSATDGSGVVVQESDGVHVRTLDLTSGAMSAPMSTVTASELTYLPPLLVEGTEKSSPSHVLFTPQSREIAEIQPYSTSYQYADGRSLVRHRPGHEPSRVPLDPWRAVADLCRLQDRDFGRNELNLLPADAYRDRPCSVLDE